ncbi:MAG TPA: glycosyltransferase [Gemmatimonadaceae bacterium]|nr:glycosyltransferase [Gemmatimonadaceae bacterium]
MSAPRDEVFVSVIVPTHDRPRALARLVGALEHGSWLPSRMELVIVADGCSDATLTAMDAIDAPFPMRTLEVTPSRGAAAARNRGASAARGDLLLFVDDDIEPLPGMIAAHVCAHEQQPGQVIMGPPLPVRSAKPDLNQLSQWAWWHDRFAAFRSPHHRFSFEDVFTGILSMRAARFHAIGGFDESLACREDYEFGARALAAGATLRFVEDGGGWHHELRSSEALASRKRAEGRADVQIAVRHPELFARLRLAEPASGGTHSWQRLRRLALSSSDGGISRWTNAALARTLGVARRALELLGWRLTWRRVNRALLDYWYWRGVQEGVGSEAGLQSLETACVRSGSIDHTEVRVDLAMGLRRALSAVDAARADSVRLLWQGAELGRIPPCAGAEPVRSEHVRRALGTNLAREYVTTRQLERMVRWLPREPRPWRRPFMTLTHAATEARRCVERSQRLLARTEPDTAALPIRPTRQGVLRANGTGIRVAEAEVAYGTPRVTLHDTGASGRVRVLLRVEGRPVDWLSVDDGESAIDRAVIAQAVIRRRCTWLTNATSDPARECPSPSPPISVVVCTRDRPEDLDECLRALDALAYPSYEVVVVDNASRSDEPRRIAEHHGVRCIREPRPGLDNARNRGILEAAHDLVAFTDDDVRVDRGWLSAIADAFADNAVQAVTGHVAPAALDTRARRLFEFAYGGMGKGSHARTWEGATLDNASRITTQHVGVGANMAFRRTVLEAVDGFDPALDVGTPSHGAGDLDMFHRLLEGGHTIRYEPRALVWHRHRESMGGLRRQLYDNGRAFGVHLLRRLREGHVSRWSTTRIFLRLMRWHAGRVIARFRRLEPLPLPLIAAEIAGALSSPVAYLRTYRSAKGAPRLSGVLHAEPRGVPPREPISGPIRPL